MSELDHLLIARQTQEKLVQQAQSHLDACQDHLRQIEADIQAIEAEHQHIRAIQI